MLETVHNASAQVNKQMAYHVLEKQSGFTQECAKALLCQYNFPYGGRIFSAYTFAQHISQTGNIPTWAERFKRMPANESHTETISVLHPEFPEHKIDFHLGKKLGMGLKSEVFLDADDIQYVIKRYFFDDKSSQIKHEAETFQRYYGEGSAQVLYEEDGTCYLRMYHVPGELLYNLPPYSLPMDAINKYADMLEKLNNVGIMHNDLHAKNILWDSHSQTFFPIDMANIKEPYFDNNGKEAKDFRNFSDSINWDIILDYIKAKSA